MRAALATPQFWVIVAAYTGCLLVNTTVHSFAFQQLIEHGESRGAATAWITAAASIAMGGSAVAGLLGERMDGRRLTLLSLAALSVAAAALAVAQGGAVLLVFALGLGVGLGFSYVGTAMLMQQYFGRSGTLELYSIMTVVSTAAAIGPGIGGIVRDATGGFAPVFLALALIDLALLGAVLALRPPVARAAAALTS